MKFPSSATNHWGKRHKGGANSAFEEFRVFKVCLSRCPLSTRAGCAGLGTSNGASKATSGAPFAFSLGSGEALHLKAEHSCWGGFTLQERSMTEPQWVPWFRFCIRTWCCASRFCAGGGEAVGSRSKQVYRLGHKLRLLDEAGNQAPAAPETRRPGQSAQAESTQGVFP